MGQTRFEFRLSVDRREIRGGYRFSLEIAHRGKGWAQGFERAWCQPRDNLMVVYINRIVRARPRHWQLMKLIAIMAKDKEANG
jgi:hypothetical protein